MPKLDFDAINAAALRAYPALLQEWMPDGRVEGHEFKAKNPTRSDHKVGSFSININTGRWGDFASGDGGGDPIDLYAYLFGLDMGRAARELGGKLGVVDDDSVPHRSTPAPRHDGGTPPAKPEGDAKAEWQPLLPVPSDASRSLPKHYRWGAPSRTWTYKDAAGAVLGFICRFDTGDGEKEILPLTFCQCTAAGFDGLNRDTGKGVGKRWAAGDRAWRWLSFPAPRPLYGLDGLAARPDAAVIMVEGEKAADAAGRLFPGHVAVAWPGGSKAMNKVEWSALAGRHVIFWPDNDKPGYDAAAGKIDKQGRLREGLMQMLNGLCTLLVISPPKDKPKGWDAADAEAEGWDAQGAADFMRERIKAAKERGPLKPREEQPEPPPAPPPPATDDPPPAEPDDAPPGDGRPAMDDDVPPSDDPAPFQVLGYNRGVYFYLPTQSGQVVELTAGSHTKLNLLQIAPLWHWENSFPKKGGVDWEMAANALMGLAHRAGVFRPHERRRGRGAWLDDGRSVLHLGDMLLVDGRPEAPVLFDTEFTYEGDSPLKVRPREPATTAEANQLVKICKDIRWEDPLSATALAGWCVVAPVCGVLNWRPHVWVTGPAGSGKTTVMRDIIGRVVGPVALQIEGKTTEAAIRHSLGYDALPVIFDEAEAEDQKSGERLQGILDLARSASSESGGQIRKATQTGGIKIYRVRSCFCFSSINTAVRHYADQTRVTPLVLAKPDNRDEERREMNEGHFEELMARIHAKLTPEFAAAMIARSVRYLATLQANADTFTKAAAVVLGNRRIGDQVGPMLAGAYLCHNTKAIGYDEALEWIRGHDWSEHTAATQSGDEERLLQHLVESRVTLSPGNGSRYERTLGELVNVVLRESNDDQVAVDVADMELRRLGIRAHPPHLMEDAAGGVFISTTSVNLKRLLRGTPWENNWRRPLLSLDGATKTSKNKRFTSALSTPAVLLPIRLFSDADAS